VPLAQRAPDQTSLELTAAKFGILMGSSFPRTGSSRAARSFSANSCLCSLLLALLALVSGCATSAHKGIAPGRQFDFQRDTFAYPNELVWEYSYNTNGQWATHRREPKPTYALHCFVVARSARQFFDNARFDPSLPKADDDTYRQLVRRVISSSARHPVREEDKVVIPGYADLRTFSQEHDELLRTECGGAWQSYFQRGHWRMIFPFSRRNQEHVAEQLLQHLQRGRPLIVHLVRFPQLSINHAMVIFDGTESEKEIQFAAYDPNQSVAPVTLTYDRNARTFILPANNYYPGGRVDVYEVFWKWDY
jgi:hypothetical protein